MASFASTLVAYAPWLAPKTLDPTGNLGLDEFAGAASTTPANSAPATHGNAGKETSDLGTVAGILGPAGGSLTRLVLVFPLDLEDVEEVGCRGVHLDQVVARTGHRIWEISNPEFLRTLWTGSDWLLGWH